MIPTAMAATTTALVVANPFDAIENSSSIPLRRSLSLIPFLFLLTD